jgi:hypothetical protein
MTTLTLELPIAVYERFRSARCYIRKNVIMLVTLMAMSNSAV